MHKKTIMMRMLPREAAAIFALVLSLSSAQNCPSLSWSDEFDGDTLNSTYWTAQIGDGCDRGQDLCGWGNNEPQWYRSENAEVSSGTLRLVAKNELYESKAYTSARIRTFEKVEFDLTQDTLVEARIKVPDGGLGLWPAFWMMPSPEVTWPRGGEIDIMEFIGREPTFVQGYMHYGAAYGDKSERGGPVRLPEPVYEDFHVFSILKTANKIAWLLDGHEYQSYTSDGIEPKYSWPFESTYHIILNVAAGGSWPGYPDESTIFPSAMEVDYVRVYDLSDGKTVPTIDGTRLVHQYQSGVEYCVSNPNGADIIWEVPIGASYVAAGADCILVAFGESSGYVKASIPSTCVAEGSYSLSIPVEVQSFYGVDFGVLDPTMTTLDFATGTTSLVTVDGVQVIQYTRSNTELYDNIQLSAPLSDLSGFLSGDRKFFLDVKTTTSAPCTSIVIQMEDSTMATPNNYPTGRHSRYQCLLEPTRDWQRVACDFSDQPDTSAATIDRIVMVIDPGMARNDVYYIGNVDVSMSGCTTNCEGLQSNGPTTNNCRKAAKSEAGACGDGINNDYEGYNGNLVTDCADPQCFNIDPVCGGPPVSTTSPSGPGASPTTNPVPTGAPVRGPAECSLNPACSSLAGDCCPTAAGIYLSCCFEAPPVDHPTDSRSTFAPTSPNASPTTINPAPNEAPFDGPAQCALNLVCSGLAGDCCPTSTGTYLSCCFEAPPVARPSDARSTFAPSGPIASPATTNPAPIGAPFDGPAECSLNSACSGLAGDCCPTSTGTYLSCCFAVLPASGYEKEYTFIGPKAVDEKAKYFHSTTVYFDSGTAPDGTSPVIAYERGSSEAYDLIYYQTQAISNAADYTSGTKKFFMDVYSEANECTQVLIQLDSLPLASEREYPIGRHSRYMAYTTKTNEWERLEFTFLDQPDATVPNDSVNAMVLFFDPGSNTDDFYYIRNLDSATIGCDPAVSTTTCETPSPKSCPASYQGEGGSCIDGIDNDMDGFTDCEDMDCMTDPACATTVSRSYASATSMLKVPGEENAGISSSMAHSHISLVVVAAAASMGAFLAAVVAF